MQNTSVSTQTHTRALSRPVRMAIGVLVFAAATAISARFQLHIPGTPVPFTFQPLVVLLSGALLGARLGAASQVLYLIAGMVGLPVFAFGGGAAYLLGPTGGYLLAGPAAAAVVGLLAGASIPRLIVAMVAGLGVIYAGGAAWLAILVGPGAVAAMGLLPFIAADLVKVVVAAISARMLRRGTLDLFGGR